MKLLCSACLLGISCRFDGKSKLSPRILALLENHELVPVCPEQLGGLPTPRTPCEIQTDGRLMNINGDDMSDQYHQGAKEANNIYLLTGCQAAILKARSPACGKGFIYDGSFSRKLISGHGIFAKLLLEKSIKVFTEEEDFIE